MIFNDAYADGTTYGIFICRAYKTYSGTSRNGAEGAHI